jgi:hypothetical protein
MGSEQLKRTMNSHFYASAGNGVRYILDHTRTLVGVRDADGNEFYYGDQVELTKPCGDIKHPGTGIILRVWQADEGCLFEVLMDNGERGFIQLRLVRKAA